MSKSQIDLLTFLRNEARAEYRSELGRMLRRNEVTSIDALRLKGRIDELNAILGAV